MTHILSVFPIILSYKATSIILDKYFLAFNSHKHFLRFSAIFVSDIITCYCSKRIKTICVRFK